MLRKNQRPLSLSSRQVQQLKQINRVLRKLNSDARRELRRIAYKDLTPARYREAGQLFGTIASRMICPLRFHHEVLKAKPEPQTHRLMVRFITPCVHSLKRSEGRPLKRHDDNETERQGMKQDPAHQAEIESLLELTNSIEDRASRRAMLRGVPLNAFFRGINRFRSAVLQQQLYLLAIAPRPIPLVELQVADGPDICTYCLKSNEIDVAMEGHDRQV
jgi:hypothetical protein